MVSLLVCDQCRFFSRVVMVYRYRLSFLCCAVLAVLCAAAGAVQRSVAVMPPLLQGKTTPEVEQVAADFQEVLLSNLYLKYDLIAVSRSQLSIIAFENQLRVAKDPAIREFRVLSCDYVIFSVYDPEKKEMRIYPVGVNEGKPGLHPVTVKLDSNNNIFAAAYRASHVLASHLLLSNARETKSGAEVADAKEPFHVAVSATAHAELSRKSAGVTRLLDAMLVERLQALEAAGAAVMVVDRQSIAQVMDEYALSGLTGEMAMSLANIQKADVLIQPRVVRDGGENVSVLTAVEPQTGALLAVDIFRGDELSTEDVQGFIDKCRSAVQYTRSEGLKDKEMIRKEVAMYLKVMERSFVLRMEKEYKQALMMEMGQAAVGLCAVVPEVRAETMKDVVYKLSYKETVPYYDEMYRRNFYQPVMSLEKDLSWESLLSQVSYWRHLKHYEKALGFLRQPGAEEARDTLYQTEANLLFRMKRYQECVDVIVPRKKFSDWAMFMAVDCYRELGQYEKELDLLYKNGRRIGTNMERSLRLLELTHQYRGAAEAAACWRERIHEQIQVEPEVVFEAAGYYLEAGEREKAIELYRSMIFRLVDGVNYPRDKRTKAHRARKELRKLGVTEVKYVPIAPASVHHFDKNLVIEVITDRTLDEGEIKASCRELADFWGMEVHLYYGVMNFSQSPTYDRVQRDISDDDARNEMRYFQEPKSDRVVYRYFYTDQSMSSSTGSVTGNIGGAYGCSFGMMTSFYDRKGLKWEPRPMYRLNTLKLARLVVVQQSMEDHDLALELVVQPYIFSNNRYLYYNYNRLSISPECVGKLAKLTQDQLMETVRKNRQLDIRRRKPLNEAQSQYVNNMSALYREAVPVVFHPLK